jgi:hypothetical protein
MTIKQEAHLLRLHTDPIIQAKKAASQRTSPATLAVIKRIHADKVLLEKKAMDQSLYWRIAWPYGRIETIKNLSKFCRENNLSQRHMWNVAAGLRLHHKNFLCWRITLKGVL